MRIAFTRWKNFVERLLDHISADRIDLVAGGVAFYALLALFPMILSAISIYGLFTTPERVESQIEAISTILPEDAHSIVVSQIRAIDASPNEGLTFGAFFGLMVALYTASRGTDALLSSIAVAYNERETRSFVRQKLLSIALTLGLTGGVLFAFTLVAVVPMAFSFFGYQSLGRHVGLLVRWPLLLALFMSGLAIMYRCAPHEKKRRFRWVSWGSFVATVLWLAASFGFSFYVARFGNYQVMYGSIGGVVVLLLWLWISAFAILLGAEIDVELEKT